MLRRFLFSILTFTAMTALSQTLQRYEYWIDSDYSRHTTVSNTKEDISFSIPTQDQAEGVHFLNFRAQNSNNDWGSISRFLYYVPENQSENPTIAGYEYWLDGDYSQKTYVQNTYTEISPVVDISKLTEGVHYYNFRAKNSDGVWGNLYRYLFYVPEAVSENPTITGYEYWLDGDYANKTYTQSSTLNVTKSIDISSLKEGVHFYNFRAKNSDGVWGNLYRYLFYVPEAVSEKTSLNGYEYWMDDDYSKHVTSVSTLGDVNLRIDISNLAEGVHYLNFRAKNSEGVSSGIKRYLFYVPESNENQGSSPIVGYRYGFNSKTNYVRVTERQSLELNSLTVPIPSNAECANVEEGTFAINESTDVVTMSRKAKIAFSMQFENKAGNWSSPTIEEFTQSDEITKNAMTLGVQKQVSFAKVEAGDYEVVKIIIPSSHTYYLRSNQYCDMQLYCKGSKMGSKVGGQTLKDTYNVGLDAGTYYAVLYNMVKNEDNTADNVVLKLMLTDNITPTPEIAYENETITITCAQDGAEIYYTIDGTDPTKESTRYTSPFRLAHNAVVKAIAVYTDLAESYVATYKIDSYKVAKPVVEFTNLQLIMTTATPDARIYYTIDGSSPSTNGMLYTAPVTMTANATVRAIAKRDNYNDSEETMYQLDVANVKCASPSANVNNNVLTLTTTTTNAAIYYTTDGTVPTTSSSLYSSPITLTENCVVKAIAAREHWVDSPVMEYTVDWFTVEKPEIVYADGKVTITCSTPDASIYYAIGGATPTTSSTLYTQPITLYDNRVLKAIAVKKNFNNSVVASYTPGNFSCSTPQISFDGRDVTIETATEGAEIYYTLDGTTPTKYSHRYTSKVRVTDLCTVKVIAMKDYMNDSEVTSYVIPAYYDGGTAKVGVAGSLSKALQWTDKSKVKTLTVTGNINDTDFGCMRTMSALEKLVISDVDISGKTIPDNALAGMNLLHVSLPSAIASVGSRILGGCTRMAAIEWNATMQMPDDILDGIKLPNLLVYARSAGYVSASFHNVIVNGVAQNVTLVDDEISNFYCPKEFTARAVSYTHNYGLPTIPGVSAGWESIALPFDAQSYTHTTKGEIAPFMKTDANKKPFWLYEYSAAGFVPTSDIKANTPYIISMPNNEEYIDDYILAGNVTFSSHDVLIKRSDDVDCPERNNYVFTPCFTHDSKDGKLAINIAEEYNMYKRGSIFVPDYRPVKPFEGYLVDRSSASRGALPIFESYADVIEDIAMYKDAGQRMYSQGGVLYIDAPRSCIINVYSIGGSKVRTVRLTKGINSIEGLNIGVYLVNKKKIYVR